MSAFNVCVRKIKTLNPRIDYFNLLDENEFVRRFRLKKSTVDKILNEIVDQLKNSTDRYVDQPIYFPNQDITF